MADARKCVVRLRDAEGVEHAVQVLAGTLYEAGCLALHQFRKSAWSHEAALETRTLQIEVWEAPTVYRINVANLEKWLERKGGSPREVALRHRIRSQIQGRGEAGSE